MEDRLHAHLTLTTLAVREVHKFGHIDSYVILLFYKIKNAKFRRCPPLKISETAALVLMYFEVTV